MIIGGQGCLQILVKLYWLRGVGDLQLWAVILHNKVQEDPSTPLQKPQKEVKDLGREVGPT
jgi:hypothetical protein